MSRSTDDIMAAVQAKKHPLDKTADLVAMTVGMVLGPGESMIKTERPLGQQTVVVVHLRRGDLVWNVGFDERELPMDSAEKFVDLVRARLAASRIERVEAAVQAKRKAEHMDAPSPLPAEEQIASLLKENERLAAELHAVRNVPDEFGRLMKIEAAVKKFLIEHRFFTTKDFPTSYVHLLRTFFRECGHEVV